MSSEFRPAGVYVPTIAGVCADTGAQLIVGAGTNDTRTTVARHEALADVPGVSASLAVVPYYVRPSETAIVAHFRAVAVAGGHQGGAARAGADPDARRAHAARECFSGGAA